MSTTKFKIFKIEISENGKFDFNQAAQNEINNFLIDQNVVYINHSTTILNLPKEDYSKIKYINKYLVVTLFYKDLSETQLELSNVSKKTTTLVKKSIEKGDDIKMPEVETNFDKKIKGLSSEKLVLDELDRLLKTEKLSKGKKEGLSGDQAESDK